MTVPQYNLSKSTHQCESEPAPDHHCHCEAAGRGNLLVFGDDKLETEGKHNPLAPRIYEGGARRAGGSPAAVRIRQRVAIEATLYRILPPVLRCAWTSPLINEGGKGCGGFRWITQPATPAVILSDRRESKDLRTSGTFAVKSVRRSFDFGLRPPLRMTNRGNQGLPVPLRHEKILPLSPE